MAAYALRRVMGLLAVWFIAVLLTFVAVQFVPGDPIMAMLSDRSGDAALEARQRAFESLKPTVAHVAGASASAPSSASVGSAPS